MIDYQDPANWVPGRHVLVGKRRGRIDSELFSGYVCVNYDDGKHECSVHIGDITLVAT